MLSALRVARILHHQRMPLGEIRAVLKADDRQVVRRYLELHLERLGERFTDQQRDLASIEQAITRPSP